MKEKTRNTLEVEYYIHCILICLMHPTILRTRIAIYYQNEFIDRSVCRCEIPIIQRIETRCF